MLIQGESSQPQTKVDQLKEENYQLQAQLKTTKSETMTALIQKRFANIMTWMDKYWDTYNKKHTVIEEHEQLDMQLHEKILELQNRDER